MVKFSRVCNICFCNFNNLYASGSRTSCPRGSSGSPSERGWGDSAAARVALRGTAPTERGAEVSARTHSGQGDRSHATRPVLPRRTEKHFSTSKINGGQIPSTRQCFRCIIVNTSCCVTLLLLCCKHYSSVYIIIVNTSCTVTLLLLSVLFRMRPCKTLTSSAWPVFTTSWSSGVTRRLYVTSSLKSNSWSSSRSRSSRPSWPRLLHVSTPSFRLLACCSERITCFVQQTMYFSVKT